MPRYVAINRRGQAICILEAEARDHADLYGLRKLPNYRRVEAIPDDFETAVETSMTEAFEALGLSSESAAIAAQGRANQETALAVIRVPNQEASSAFRGPSATTRSDLAGAISRGDAVAVQRLALKSSRGAPAPRSLPEPRPAAESASRVAVELTEAFQDLGLSAAGAKLAAGGRG
jgi:hypothetical protein